jgi:hypothetical protein
MLKLLSFVLAVAVLVCAWSLFADMHDRAMAACLEAHSAATCYSILN